MFVVTYSDFVLPVMLLGVQLNITVAKKIIWDKYFLIIVFIIFNY